MNSHTRPWRLSPGIVSLAAVLAVLFFVQLPVEAYFRVGGFGAIQVSLGSWGPYAETPLIKSFMGSTFLSASKNGQSVPMQLYNSLDQLAPAQETIPYGPAAGHYLGYSCPLTEIGHNLHSVYGDVSIPYSGDIGFGAGEVSIEPGQDPMHVLTYLGSFASLYWPEVYPSSTSVTSSYGLWQIDATQYSGQQLYMGIYLMRFGCGVEGISDQNVTSGAFAETFGRFGRGTGPSDPNAVILGKWDYSVSIWDQGKIFDDQMSIFNQEMALEPGGQYWFEATVRSGAKIVPEPAGFMSFLCLLPLVGTLQLRKRNKD